MVREQIIDKFKDKVVVINDNLYRVKGIELPTVNKIFTTVGLLTKIKNET